MKGNNIRMMVIEKYASPGRIKAFGLPKRKAKSPFSVLVVILLMRNSPNLTIKIYTNNIKFLFWS